MTSEPLHPAPAERLPRPAVQWRGLQLALLLGGLIGLGLLCGGQAHADDVPGGVSSTLATHHGALRAGTDQPVARGAHAVRDRASDAVRRLTAEPARGTREGGEAREARLAGEMATRPRPVNVRQVTDHVGQLTASPRELTQTVGELPEPVGGLTGTVDGLTKTAGELTGTVDGLTETAGGLTGTVDGLTKTAGGLTGTLGGLTETAGGLTGTLGGLTENVGGLAGQVIGGVATATSRPLPDAPPVLPGVPRVPELPDLPGHSAPAPAPRTPPAPSTPADPTAPAGPSEPTAGQPQPPHTAAPEHDEHPAHTSAALATRVAGPAVYGSTEAGGVHHDGAHQSLVARRAAAPQPAAPGTPPRPDGVLGANASAGVGSSTRHSDLHAAAFAGRVPVLLLPGALAPGVPAPVADRQRGIPEFPG